MNNIRALTTTLVIAYVVCAIMPEEWIAKTHLGVVPLDCLILTFVCCSLYVELFGSPTALTPALLGGVAALALMGTYGYVRGNIDKYSLKFFVADVYYFASFLAGLAFGHSRDRTTRGRIVTTIGWVAAAGIIVNYAGLFMGLLGTQLNVPKGRQVTGSIFVSCGILLILLPWTSMARLGSERRRTGWRVFIFFALAAATVLLSGTRSTLLAILFVLLLCGALNPQWRNKRLFPRLLGASLLLALLLASGLPVFETVLFERLATQGVVDESRSTEVSMLWGQISRDVVLGQGMGSRFISDVVVEGDPLASAPHIGILTFLMKGGVLVFAAYAIAPLVRALRVFFSAKSLTIERGAASSMLVYIALSCMSGGWNPIGLFLYGLAASAITGEAKRLERVHAFGSAPLETPA
jgi:hypothetical protein